MWYAAVNRDGFNCLARKLTSFPSYQSPLTPAVLGGFRFMTTQGCREDAEHVTRMISSLAGSQPPSTSSSLLLRNVTNLSSDVCNKLHTAITTDDSSQLSQLLGAQGCGQAQLHLRLGDALLLSSVLWRSQKCTQCILARLPIASDNSAVPRYNPLHLLLIRMGQSASMAVGEMHFPIVTPSRSDLAVESHTEPSQFLSLVLAQLAPRHHQLLLQKDGFGRTPLHYAAAYGLTDEFCLIMRHMQDWHLLCAETMLDSSNHTPLHLAVLGGHSDTVAAITSQSQMLSHVIEETDPVRTASLLGELVHLATTSKSSQVLRALLRTGKVNPNFVARNGETALLVAARFGHGAHVEMLLKASFFDAIDVDKCENAYGLTPLMAACIGGHLSIVESLVDAGADQKLCDMFGWAAKDHAAFRGFWKISERLGTNCQQSPTRIPKMVLPKTNRLPPCLPDEHRVFVNLGALNTRKPRPVVDLSPYLSKYPSSPYPETGFSVRISPIDATNSSHIVRLPLTHDQTNHPFVFVTKDPASAKLSFALCEDAADSPEGVLHIGSAVALLADLRQGLGSSLESLIRDHTVPIIGKHSFQLIGTITFNFVIAKSFPDPRPSPITDHHLWLAPKDNTILVGHRGLGQNSPAFKRLQIGENTIQSFLSTANLGVPFIECDVQLTGDLVPVIYHDFLVSESGADLAPLHLSLDQFRCISEMQKPVYSAFPKREGGHLGNQTRASRSRSYSLDLYEDFRTHDFSERISHTHEFKLKGFKGNVRGAHIHEPFTTLEEILRTVPENVGLDVELKYPMLWEAEDWKMDTYGIEFNTYTDAILEIVYRRADRRAIIFTSFSPELCILMSHKQDTYPVLFLNESNLFPTGDVRASNLQEAVHFARHWGLLGVVMSSEPFITSPFLIRYVKDAGLLCSSFGALNNDPECAMTQAKAGLDILIVDSVALIAHTFRTTLATASSVRETPSI